MKDAENGLEKKKKLGQAWQLVSNNIFGFSCDVHRSSYPPYPPTLFVQKRKPTFFLQRKKLENRELKPNKKTNKIPKTEREISKRPETQRAPGPHWGEGSRRCLDVQWSFGDHPSLDTCERIKRTPLKREAEFLRYEKEKKKWLD